MSALSPRVDQKLAKVLGDALRLLANKYPEEPFPTIKEHDPNGSLEDGYLCIEGKNILISVLLCDLWEELREKNKRFDLPAISKCPPGYRISTASWWPEKTASEGTIGYAADLQADTAADLTFTRLMYLNSKSIAKKHGDLITASFPDEGEENPEEDVDMEDPDTEGLVAPPPENLLPSPWLEKKDFRLTRDWSKFPSAGLLSHPVSDVSQAQYGAVADTIFESMKVEVIKAKAKTSKAIMGEVSLDGDGLARDSGAAAVYRPILEAYISDGSIKGRLIRSASKHVEAQVNQFVDWFRDHEEEYETGYLDDQAEQKDFAQQLYDIPPEGLGSFYVRACKIYATMKAEGSNIGSINSAMTASAGTPSLAGTTSLMGNDDDGLDPDIQAAPVSDRGRGRGRGRGSGSGRGRATGSGRGRGRGFASSGTLGTGAGSKRGRETEVDEADDDEHVPSRPARKR